METNSKQSKTIALCGNPNVGKSTIFNSLTGLKQHTGNWPGKTVSNAKGFFETKKSRYTIVDIPGTYSLFAHSPEEEIARDFICFGNSEKTVIVCDGTNLQRSLPLCLQTLEITNNAILCVNLLDEAKAKNIEIDLEALSKRLSIPVIGTVAKDKKSLKSLISELEKEGNSKTSYKVIYPEKIENAISVLEPILKEKLGEKISPRWLALRLLENDTAFIKQAEVCLNTDISSDKEILKALENAKEILGEDIKNLKDIVSRSVILSSEILISGIVSSNNGYSQKDRKADKFLTGKISGFLVMLLLLCFIFWLTVTGANYISSHLSSLMFFIEEKLNLLFLSLGFPVILRRILIEGVWRVPAWVVSVMLPPMAIFFPLFTLLEDSGYLPRIAFNLDKPFKKCNGCGKQALTMCMGFGCNAAGVIGTRIIDSKRERMLAILTNNLVPCNGRFPTIITLIAIFFVSSSSVLSAVLLTFFILIGIFVTFFSTKLLSKTVLKGSPSSYILEMPPYRKPQFIKVIIRSVFDKTAFVLARAVAVAVPAGIIIWALANITISNHSLIFYCSEFLNPIAEAMGLDGVILLAFILGFPANEIVIPIALMAYLGNGNISDISSVSLIGEILISNGWTIKTALCTIIFSLFHWPCSTTVLTIKKETGSFLWTLFAIFYPTLLGAVCCVFINLIFNVFA